MMRTRRPKIEQALARNGKWYIYNTEYSSEYLWPDGWSFLTHYYDTIADAKAALAAEQARRAGKEEA